MKLEKHKLETVKNALQYAVMSAKTESETAEYALLLLDVQTAIVEEKERDIRLEKLKSLEGCVFHYCDSNPKCEGKCRYDNKQLIQS